MSKINPLYILGLAVVLFVSSYMLLSNKKGQLEQLNQNYQQKFALAKEFKLLKSNYKNKEQKLGQIKALKNINTFKKEQLTIKETKKSIQVVFKSKKPKVLQKFLNHVLQERFIYKKFNVSLNQVTFEVEK